MAYIFKKRPDDDTNLKKESEGIPSSWEKIEYKYIQSSRDLEVYLSNPGSYFVLAFDSTLSLNEDAKTKIRGLQNSYVTLGPDSLGCFFQELKIDNYLKNQQTLRDISSLEINCEFYSRLHNQEPTFSVAKIKDWVSQNISNGTITKELFESFPSFTEKPLPPSQPKTINYRLFAPSDRQDSVTFDLKFFSRQGKSLNGISTGDDENKDFAVISKDKLKINLSKGKMTNVYDGGVYHQPVTIFETTNLPGSRVEQPLDFKVSFVEKLEIQTSKVASVSLFPGVKNKRLYGKIKFVGDSKLYDFNDPSVASRLGVSGNVLNWSTSGSLFSVSSIGEITVPENSIIPSGSTINDFFKAVTDPKSIKTQPVFLNLNANYTQSTMLTLSVAPSLKWYPLVSGSGIDGSGLIKRLDDTQVKLKQIEQTLNQSVNILEQIKKIVPLLGLFDSFSVPNALSILAGPIVDTVISFLGTGFYFTTLNPLSDSDLKDKGNLTAAALDTKKKRSEEVLNKFPSIWANTTSGFGGLTDFTTDTVMGVGMIGQSALISALESAKKTGDAVSSGWSSTRDFFSSSWSSATSSLSFSPDFTEADIISWNSFITSGSAFFYPYPKTTLPSGAAVLKSPVAAYLNTLGIGVASLTQKDLGYINEIPDTQVSRLNENLNLLYGKMQKVLNNKISSYKPTITTSTDIQSLLTQNTDSTQLLNLSNFKIEKKYVSQAGDDFISRISIVKGDFEFDSALRKLFQIDQPSNLA